MFSEGNVITSCDQLADGHKPLRQPLDLSALEQRHGWEAAHDNITWNQIGEDNPFLIQCLAMALVVCCLECNSRGMEEVIRKEIASKIIKVRYPLRGRKIYQRRRLGADAGEHLFGIAELTTLM